MSSPSLPKRIQLDNIIETICEDAKNGKTWVYFAWADHSRSQFKVGYTMRGPELRTHELALGNSHLRLWCAVPGCALLETYLKGRFTVSSVDGREIFHTQPWKTYIERLAKKYGKFYRA